MFVLLCISNATFISLTMLWKTDPPATRKKNDF